MRRISIVASVSLLAACAGRGSEDWEKAVKPVVDTSCVHCHNPATIDDVVARTCAATIADGDAAFGPDKFMAEYLQKTASLQDRDALFTSLCQGSGPKSEAKARVLYGLKNLKELLVEPTPPSYASQDAFEAFITLAGPDGGFEGCEMLDFLDKGNAGSAEGMAPLWAEALMKAIGETYTPPTNTDRDAVRKYVEYLLPLGAGSCTGGNGDS